ncbi:hypothetical protein OTB20_12045 [Streptomyces sp. H27-H1]|uniref:hypothetical protein n=1 Tax=Streptomyces sp. H27-H1 TaxID=2996461 RepID=UPI00226E8077|nr:hypothetical protein [Streptomyces sp. H27-H1]MCY0926922.1 hypothetical protein [Streptomyces sp. H27-H1]
MSSTITDQGLSPKAIRAMANITKAMGTVEPAVAEVLGRVGDMVMQSGDPDAVYDFVLTALQRTKDEQTATPCAAYSWCAETGEHHDHTGHSIWATCPDAYGREVLPAGLIEWGGGVKVGLLDLDLTPAEAHGKVTELRAHLDSIEALINLAEAER